MTAPDVNQPAPVNPAATVAHVAAFAAGLIVDAVALFLHPGHAPAVAQGVAVLGGSGLSAASVVKYLDTHDKTLVAWFGTVTSWAHGHAPEIEAVAKDAHAIASQAAGAVPGLDERLGTLEEDFDEYVKNVEATASTTSGVDVAGIVEQATAAARAQIAHMLAAAPEAPTPTPPAPGPTAASPTAPPPGPPAAGPAADQRSAP